MKKDKFVNEFNVKFLRTYGDPNVSYESLITNQELNFAVRTLLLSKAELTKHLSIATPEFRASYIKTIREKYKEYYSIFLKDKEFFKEDLEKTYDVKEASKLEYFKEYDTISVEYAEDFGYFDLNYITMLSSGRSEEELSKGEKLFTTKYGYAIGSLFTRKSREREIEERIKLYEDEYIINEFRKLAGIIKEEEPVKIEKKMPWFTRLSLKYKKVEPIIEEKVEEVITPIKYTRTETEKLRDEAISIVKTYGIDNIDSTKDEEPGTIAYKWRKFKPLFSARCFMDVNSCYDKNEDPEAVACLLELSRRSEMTKEQLKELEPLPLLDIIEEKTGVIEIKKKSSTYKDTLEVIGGTTKVLSSAATFVGTCVTIVFKLWKGK